MGEAERRELIRRYWEGTGGDENLSDEIYHDDAVLEFPQSGERFEGLTNFREWRGQYPDARGTSGSWKERSATTTARNNPP